MRRTARTPGFTAEAALLPSPIRYRGQYHLSTNSAGAVTPAAPFLCAILGAACVAAILDPVPGSEIAMCGYFATRCAVSAVGGTQTFVWD